jgi:hypothetical protein
VTYGFGADSSSKDECNGSGELHVAGGRMVDIGGVDMSV